MHGKFFESHRMGHSNRMGKVWLLCSVALLAVGPAFADPPSAESHVNDPDANKPVTFEADRVSYDKERSLMIAQGHVEAWQNGNILRADKVVFDKTHNTAAAYGHVILIQPNQEVIFGEYAELTGGMKNGIMTAMRAQLPLNVKVAATGGRRTDSVITDMSRVVYSPCNCDDAKGSMPLWQIRAKLATRDTENQRIEYQNAWLDIDGWPVFWLPFFSQTDPSVKRQSGFLMPWFGLSDQYLGTFLSVPYFYVIDGQSDVTVTPLIDTKSGPQLQLEYERRFNSGKLYIDGAIADLSAGDDGGGGGPAADVDHGIQGFLKTQGIFNWNDTWRWGFNINYGSSIDYMRDYRLLGLGQNVETSTAFIEGFGVGSYSRVDVVGYQALNSAVSQNNLPYQLPGYQYSFVGLPDFLGGRFRFDTQDFNVIRDIGTNDQRLAARVGWDDQATGQWGDRWNFTVESQDELYRSTFLDGEPNYSNFNGGTAVQGMGQAAAKVNWPFVRLQQDGESQTIEPIAQAIIAPQAGNSATSRLPNEDSLGYEFTDSSLFSLNRFTGYDRFDGGARVNYGLHTAWDFAGGEVLDALVGQSWREHIESNLYPQFQPWNGFGLNEHLSDIVARASLVPNSWTDFTVRGRFDHQNGDIRFADAVVGFGPSFLRGNIGYVYSSVNPFDLYTSDFHPGLDLVDYNGSINCTTKGTHGTCLPSNFYQPRDEVSGGLTVKHKRYSASANTQYNLSNGSVVGYGFDLKYEDECFIFDLSGYRRYTSINYDQGNTTVLFTITFKTLGPLAVKG